MFVLGLSGLGSNVEISRISQLRFGVFVLREILVLMDFKGKSMVLKNEGTPNMTEHLHKLWVWGKPSKGGHRPKARHP